MSFNDQRFEDNQVIKACNSALAKWEAILNSEEPLIAGKRTCALCTLFRHEDCERCPLSEVQQSCLSPDTAWDSFRKEIRVQNLDIHTRVSLNSLGYVDKPSMQVKVLAMITALKQAKAFILELLDVEDSLAS